jgi:hypothetical protein
MDNDEGSQEYYTELAGEIYSGASSDEPFTRFENAAMMLSH